MINAISLDQAAYKAELMCSLYEIILDIADKECSGRLVNLISIACDANFEINLALQAVINDHNAPSLTKESDHE